jgi:hypothetical protein
MFCLHFFSSLFGFQLKFESSLNLIFVSALLLLFNDMVNTKKKKIGHFSVMQITLMYEEM